MPYPNFMTAAEQICLYGKNLWLRQMVAANDGNLSCRLQGGGWAITPTGCSKGMLNKKEIIRINESGERQAGQGRSSIETQLHLAVYRACPAAGAVIHTHSVAATAFASIGEAPQERFLPEAIVNLGQIALVPYFTPGSEALAQAVGAAAEDLRALLLANHGAVCYGCDLKEAYFRIEVLEHYLQILLLTRGLGGARELTAEQLAELEDF